MASKPVTIKQNSVLNLKFDAVIPDKTNNIQVSTFDFKNSKVHSASSLLECFLMSCLQFGQIPDSSSDKPSSTCFMQHSINSSVECDSIASLHVGHSVNFIQFYDICIANKLYLIFFRF